MYFIIGCFFIPIGAKCLITSTRVVELAARYDNLPQCAAAYQQGTCVVNLTVARSMSSPIYVYYQIEGMHLNHRRRARPEDTQNETGTQAPFRQNGAEPQQRPASRRQHDGEHTRVVRRNDVPWGKLCALATRVCAVDP